MEEAFAQGFSALSKSAFVITLLAGLAAGAFYSGSPVYADGGCGACNIEQPALLPETPIGSPQDGSGTGGGGNHELLFKELADGGCGGCKIEQPVLVRNLLMIYLKPLSPYHQSGCTADIRLEAAARLKNSLAPVAKFTGFLNHTPRLARRSSRRQGRAR
jgi:hypothetical protein